MTPARLVEIRERLSKATPGPWLYHDCKVGTARVGCYDIISAVNSEVFITISSERNDDDGAFIANAPTDIRDLLSEVERLQGVIAQHDLCHDLHGKVDARAFADGCAAEQRKLYGCAPDGK